MPQSVTATSGNAELLIAWQAPATGSVISTYRLRWKLASAGDFAAGDARSVDAPETSTTITGLTNGSAYDVEVSGENAQGVSAAATAQGTPNPVPPSAPQNPAAAPGNAQLQVTWSAPDDNGGAAVANYRLRWKLASESNFAAGDTTTVGAVTSATISGLTNGGLYDVEITAGNSAGFGTAATARHFARSPESMALLAALFAALAVLGGIALSLWLDTPAGASIVAVGAAGFAAAAVCAGRRPSPPG